MTLRRSLALALLAVSVILPVSAEAAAPCEVAAARAAAPAGDPACPGVRPGALAYNPKTRESCTFGFLFRGSDGARYALMGHICAQPKAEQSGVGVGALFSETVWKPGKGPRIYDSTNRPVGHAVYDILDLFNGHDLDVALMRLDPRTPYNPRVCMYGGPRGIDSRITTFPETVDVYGQGNPLIVGYEHGEEDTVPYGLNRREAVKRLGVNEMTNSGAPVVMATDGHAALGVMGKYAGEYGVSAEDPTGHDPAGSKIFRLAYVLSRIQPKIGVRLTLINSGER